MDENSKTKAELITELEELRQRTAALSSLVMAKYQSAAESDPFFNLSLDMFAIMKLDSTILRLNQAFANNLGYAIEELLQTKARDMVHPEDEKSNEKILERMISGRSAVNFENRIRHNNGTYRWFNWTMTPFIEAELIYGVGRDVTERKEAEKIRSELMKEREISDFRRTLLSIASHDLRNPLASMRISAEMLLRENVRSDPEKFQYRVHRILDDIDRQTSMFNKLSLFVKSREGQFNFIPHPGNIETFCQSVIDEVKPRLNPNQNIRFSCEGDPRNVLFDDMLLIPPLTNLLTNAIKYSPDGGTIHFDVRINEDIIIRIRDEGIGISPENQANLFEPYFRSERVKHIEGTGLGLSITRDCVALHHGTIDVESQLGIGSTFIIILPRQYELGE